jgi:hypothetical protein
MKTYKKILEDTNNYYNICVSTNNAFEPARSARYKIYNPLTGYKCHQEAKANDARRSAGAKERSDLQGATSKFMNIADKKLFGETSFGYSKK